MNSLSLSEPPIPPPIAELTCPSCGGRVSQINWRCILCGLYHHLAVCTDPHTDRLAGRRCIQCGHGINLSATHCPYCGFGMRTRGTFGPLLPLCVLGCVVTLIVSTVAIMDPSQDAPST